ncbi:MAG TPA: BON domain-containing protein [Pyrinomonadaceae bacterium]|nr:BON domain-containing protein [Pyrinomonadaceae bacterium]
MAYDEEQARKSRVVVETPNERREVVHSQSVRDNGGISAGMVGVLVVVAIALITMLVLFWISSQPATDNANVAATQPPPTTVVQQPAPAQQPPVIIQQPAPATQPAPIIVTPPASGGSTMPAESVNMDSTIQTAVDKRLSDDQEISTLGITATVINGKVTLLGTVKTEALKSQVERLVKQVKGVKSVDNQISVIAD